MAPPPPLLPSGQKAPPREKGKQKHLGGAEEKGRRRKREKRKEDSLIFGTKPLSLSSFFWGGWERKLQKSDLDLGRANRSPRAKKYRNPSKNRHQEKFAPFSLFFSPSFPVSSSSSSSFYLGPASGKEKIRAVRGVGEERKEGSTHPVNEHLLGGEEGEEEDRRGRGREKGRRKEEETGE